jgi:hypothetical protein
MARETRPITALAPTLSLLGSHTNAPEQLKHALVLETRHRLICRVPATDLQTIFGRKDCAAT